MSCPVETNLAWNLAEKERLTLYNDSAEELGWLAGFQCFFFGFERGSVQLGPVSRKPRKLFEPVKPLQNLDLYDCKTVLLTYS